MRVRIVSVALVSDGQGHRYEHGQLVELDDDLANDWIVAGFAEPAPPIKPVRAAEAVKRAPRTTRRR